MAGSRPSESFAARLASSTASAPLRIEESGFVASVQAVSFSREACWAWTATTRAVGPTPSNRLAV